MQPNRLFLLFCAFFLVSCQTIPPTLTGGQIRATNQAEQTRQVIELTRQPNARPEVSRLIQPEHNQAAVPLSADLEVSVTDPEGDPLSVTFYCRPRIAIDQPFKIIVLPDTQMYAMYYPEIAIRQNEWIMQQKDEDNIVAIIHVGDSVHEAEQLEQWENASQAIQVLGEEIPYGIAVGNHDQVPKDEPENSTENFNAYFGVDFFKDRSYYGGHYGDNNDNSYILFSASGIDFIVLFLEFDNQPNPEVMTWASEVLVEHADRFAIVAAHSLLFANGNWTPQGKSVYKHLKHHPNVQLMVSGHIPGESRREDKFRSHTIHTLLSDFQTDDMGGNGMLRILTFDPAADQIHVQTYSPTLDQYQLDEDSDFYLSVDIDHPFMQIARHEKVESDGIVKAGYPIHATAGAYDWYVEVEDPVSLVQSPVWSFSTE